MKILIAFITLLSFNSFAAPKMKPGLWEMKIKILHNGKEYDPMAEFKKQLEKMPEAQRKMILDKMSKDKSDTNVANVCITKEQAEKAEHFATKGKEGCEYKTKTETATKIVSDFKCDDGTRGTVTVNMEDPNNIRSVIDSVDKTGTKVQMKNEAKFLRAECK